MNVRPADSNALAAATDFFAATSPCQDMGPIPFERLLRTPTPPPLERPAPRQDGNRVSSCPASPAPAPAITNETQAVHDDVEATHEPTDQHFAEATTKGSTVTSDEPHPATDIVGHDLPRGEEANDSQRDVAAESLLAAMTVQTAPVVVEEQVKAPAVDPTLTDLTDANAKETDDVTPTTLLEVRAAHIAEIAATSTAVTAQSGAEVQSMECMVTISPPVANETLEDAPPAKGQHEVELPPHGIGVLPSALATNSTRPANKPGSGNTPRPVSHRLGDATPEQESDLEQSVDSTVTDEMRSRGTKESARDNEPLLAMMRSNGTGPQPPQQGPLNLPLPSDAPVETGPLASVEPPPSAASSRNDITESRVPSPAPAHAPPTAAPTTSGIAQRLPNHVLVRSNNNPAEPGALQVDTVRFIQRVARAFDSAREQGTEVRLRLSPPELGALRVEVNMVEQGLVARVEAETPEARTILLDNLPALRERLAEQGVKLERFDVDLSHQRSNQDQRHEPNQSQERQSPAQPRTTRPATIVDVNTPNRSITQSPTIHDRRLNVIV